MGILGLDRDANAGAPLVSEPDAPVSPLLLRELHDDLLRRKRRAFLAGSPLLLLALFGWAVAATDPGRFGGMAFLSVFVVALVGQQGLEWWKLRRAEPSALYTRELAQAEQSRQALIAHQAKTAEVAPVVSSLLTGTIVAVAIVQFLFSPTAIWLTAGALIKPAVKAGEWWRLLTCTYLHGSVMHVAWNMGALFAFARLIETYDRRMRVPLIYLVSAIAGSLLSTALLAAPSVGASGGVLGLAGYVVAISRRPGSALPAWVRREMLNTLALTAFMGMAAFFLIDNAGHAGGALAGAAIGLALRPGNPSASRDTGDNLGATAAMVLVAGALFTIARLLRWL